MSDWYILDGKTPVHEPDFMKAARWFETANRVVARTTVNGLLVSTVFLGIDHSFGGGPPSLFETMVFGSSGEEIEDYTERCSTWDEAEAQHKQAVAMVEAKTKGQQP